MSNTHYLKTWPEYFQAIVSEKKTFEVRLNDRNFQVGDILFLEEYDPINQQLTKRVVTREITYILHGGQFGIENGICIMSVKPVIHLLKEVED